MSKYLIDQADTKKTIFDDGSAIKIIKVKKFYDPQSLVSHETTEIIESAGIVMNFSSREIDGTLIQATDFKLMIPGDIEIDKQETIVLNDKKYQIVNNFPEIHGNIAVFQILHLRS